MTRAAHVWLALVSVSVSGAACSRETGVGTRPHGVVLITLDTTRADRLSAYGFMDASMPALDRLAREGVAFDQATTVAPLTLPAHASLLTGLLPPAHGIRDNGDPPLAAEHVTLAEILRAASFRTGAFVASVILDRQRGLDQGFDRYDGVGESEATATAAGQRRAEATVTEALTWLETVGDSRFFLWLHLYDPHRPYAPPEPFATRFAADPYVGEIAYADSQIGRLVAALERKQLFDRSIVIVAGDHGESLGEHGERDHGIFIYESVLRVPLIIRAPAMPDHRTSAVVRLIDVLPTTLDLLGLPAPRMHGTSLRSLMQGGETELDAYAESLYPRQFGWSALRSLRDGRFKYIEAPRAELYDLERDPWEERNIHDERATVVAAMKQRLTEISASIPRREATRDHRAISDDMRQRLASLGYVSAGISSSALTDEGAPDPKDCIAFFTTRHAPSSATRRPATGSQNCAGGVRR